MTARDDFSKQFQEYLRIVYEGRWVILILLVIVVTATWFYTLQQDDIYQSRATIRLKRALDPLNYQNYQGLGAQDLGWGGERIIANEIRVIRSDEVADKVATSLLALVPEPGARVDTLPILKAQARPTTLRKIARSLKIEHFLISLGVTRLDTSSLLATKAVISGRARGQVSAQPVSGLDFIEVVAESTSPKEAAYLANLTVDAYKLRNLEAARENVTTARKYLASQLDTKRDSLSHAENELRSFQQGQGVVSLDEETRTMIEQVSSFEAARDQGRIDLEATSKTLSEMRKQLETIEPNLAKKLSEGSDPVLRTLLTEKAELEKDIMEAEYNRKEALEKRKELDEFSKKAIQDKQKRLDEVKVRIDQIAQRTADAKDVSNNPLQYSRDLRQKIVEKEIEIEAIKSKLVTLDKTITEYNKKFESIPSQSIEFARLERRRQSFEKLNAMLDQKFQESVINEQTTMGSVDIIDKAGVPSKPVRPNRPLNMLIGVIVGLALGLGVAFGMHYLDNTIRNPEDVEKMGFPVLTFVPSFGSGSKQSLDRSESLVTLTAPQSPPSEAYRTLRTAIENSLMNGKSMVVIISSPAPKEGKSTAIANLAVSAASSARRVLLIDADLRRPVQHNIFEIDREPGLSNALVGEVPVKDAIKKTKIPGLHVMPCGHIPSHPAELLGSAKMQKFLQLIRQYYDLIVIDSPPVIAMADTLVIAKYADGVVLVVSADTTKTLGLEKARDLIEANNGKIVGTVVNRFNANKLYYSYYRYYYQNYYYYSEDGTRKRRSSGKKRASSAKTSEETTEERPS